MQGYTILSQIDFTWHDDSQGHGPAGHPQKPCRSPPAHWAPLNMASGEGPTAGGGSRRSSPYVRCLCCVTCISLLRVAQMNTRLLQPNVCEVSWTTTLRNGLQIIFNADKHFKKSEMIKPTMQTEKEKAGSAKATGRCGRGVLACEF